VRIDRKTTYKMESDIALEAVLRVARALRNAQMVHNEQEQQLRVSRADHLPRLCEDAIAASFANADVQREIFNLVSAALNFQSLYDKFKAEP
jgi:hypothetical protein